MDTKNHHQSELNSNQEIDLLFLFKKIKALFTDLALAIFRFFQFIARNKVILVLLLGIGLGIGFAYDKLMPKKFKTELLVIPNFNSTEYLYSEVENISSNYLDNGNENKLFEDLIAIKISPVIEIKSFLNNEGNKEFLKLLADNGQDFESFLDDETIAKVNKFHLITLTTNSNKHTDKLVKALMNNLNNSSYFKQRQGIEQKNLETKKIQLTKSIEQINLILDKLGSENQLTSKNDVSINSYDQMNTIIDLKKTYVEELGDIETKLIEFNEVIYPVNVSLNNNDSNRFYLKGMFILPILFIFGFIGFKSFQSFYRKYDQISKMNNED